MSIANRKLVTVFGGIHLDRIGYANSVIHPDTSTPGSVEVRLGGVATNVARVLSALGHQVTICGIIGADTDGDKIIELLRELNIEHANLVRQNNFPTPTYLALHNPNGSLAAAVSDTRLTETLSTNGINWSASEIKHSELWFVDTNLNLNLIQEIATNAKDRFLVADTVSTIKAKKLSPILQHLNFIFTNLAEANSLLNKRFSSAEQAAKSFIEQGIEMAMITNGSKQTAFANISSKKQIEIITKIPPTVSVQDVTGAGDIAIGVMLHGLLLGWSNEHSLETATTVSARAISSSKFTLEEIVQEIVKS